MLTKVRLNVKDDIMNDLNADVVAVGGERSGRFEAGRFQQVC